LLITLSINLPSVLRSTIDQKALELSYYSLLGFRMIIDINFLKYNCYKLKTLELVKRIDPVLGLTQKNSIENSVQDCLPYIQIPNGLCELFLAYPKWPCVCLKVNICITHCMTLSFLKCSISFHMSCDLSLSLLLCHLMWLMCDQVMSSLTLTLNSKNRKIEIRSESREKLSPLLAILTIIANG